MISSGNVFTVRRKGDTGDICVGRLDRVQQLPTGGIPNLEGSVLTHTDQIFPIWAEFNFPYTTMVSSYHHLQPGSRQALVQRFLGLPGHGQTSIPGFSNGFQGKQDAQLRIGLQVVERRCG